MHNEENPSCAGPFGGAQIDFPQKFDLRIIYSVEGKETMRADLATIFAMNSLLCERVTDVPTRSGKYARLAATVEFVDLGQMRAVYEAVGKIPFVKGLL